MRKITQVRLKNFQSHEDTTISFDDYNIIYGKTNSGKSAILRGIKWALYNLPPAEGVDFRRFGTKETIVTVSFDDGRKITRRRTAKENEYILEDENGKRSFTQFGRGPLKEVLDFHGMYQVNLFGSPQSINIVEQSEPPFFLSNGPTARGKLIGRLAGTVLYENALALAKKDASILHKTISTETEELEKTQKAIESLAYVDDLKEFLDSANAVSQRADKDEADLKTVAAKEEVIHSSFLRREENLKLAAFKDAAIKANETFDGIMSTNHKTTQIENYKSAMLAHFETWLAKKQFPYSVHALDEISERLNELLNISANLTRVSVKTDEMLEKMKILHRQDKMIAAKITYSNDVEQLIHHIEETDDFKAKVSALAKGVSDKYESLANYDSQIENANNAIASKQKEYKEALLSAGVCPTCGQLVDEAVAAKIDL